MGKNVKLMREKKRGGNGCIQSVVYIVRIEIIYLFCALKRVFFGGGGGGGEEFKSSDNKMRLMYILGIRVWKLIPDVGGGGGWNELTKNQSFALDSTVGKFWRFYFKTFVEIFFLENEKKMQRSPCGLWYKF